MTSPQAPFAVQSVIGVSDLLAAVRAMNTVRANEIDGEESDGTPRSWRNRPFVSLTQIERLLEARKIELPTPLDDAALQQLFGDAIENALACGARGIDAPPVGHWLARFWKLGCTQTAQDDLCGHCNGSGEQSYLVGGGPDAHDETGPCSGCAGTGAVAVPGKGDASSPPVQAIKGSNATQVEDSSGQASAGTQHAGQGAVPAIPAFVQLMSQMLPMLRRDYLDLAAKYAGTPFENDAAYQDVKNRYEQATALVQNAGADARIPVQAPAAKERDEFKEIVKDLVYQKCFDHLKPDFQERVRELLNSQTR